MAVAVLGHWARRLSTMLLHGGVLLLLLQTVTVVAKLCSKVVAEESPAKRVQVLRRMPSVCSNWDKSWAWLTKIDCGTKYSLDYITVPPSEVIYKMKYTCCEGDTQCKEAAGMASPGFTLADDKFLAIILGSTAAALFILIIVIVISVCHRRQKLGCPVICDDRSHIYETADDLDEATQLQGSRDGDLCGDDTGIKACCESEYEEIGDGRYSGPDSDTLPRYMDIFKEKEKLAQELGIQPAGSDPFKEATAPPLKLHEAVPSPPPRTKESEAELKTNDVQEVLHGTAEILQREASSLQKSGSEKGADKMYYNVSEGGNNAKTAAKTEVEKLSDVEAKESEEKKTSKVQPSLSSTEVAEGGESGKGDLSAAYSVSEEGASSPQSPASTTYEKVGNSQSDPSHDYECLVDFDEPSVDSRSEDSVHTSNSSAPKSMNGHVGAANC